MNLSNKRLLVGQAILLIAAAIGFIDRPRVLVAVAVGILGLYFWVSTLIPVNGNEDNG